MGLKPKIKKGNEMRKKYCNRGSIVDVDCVYEDGKFFMRLPPSLSNLVTLRFTAPADYSAGDVMVVKGREFPVRTPGMTAASSDIFKAGAVIHCDIDMDRGLAFFWQGGVQNVVQNTAGNRVTYDAAGNGFPTRASLTGAIAVYHAGQAYIPAARDYAVVIADEDALAPFTNGQTLMEYDGVQWDFAYGINDRPFTAAEWAAIDSGITQELVQKIGQGGGAGGIIPDWDNEQLLASTGNNSVFPSQLNTPGSWVTVPGDGFVWVYGRKTVSAWTLILQVENASGDIHTFGIESRNTVHFATIGSIPVYSGQRVRIFNSNAGAWDSNDNEHYVLGIHFVPWKTVPTP